MDKAEVLQRYFGFSAFRPGQEALIDGVLSGRDVFGIMPTGGGKSMCYQIPALMLPGITLVISPLVSLMRDQVMALKSVGVAAAYINSTLNAAQMQLVYRNLLAGMYKIVYVAPERLDYSGFASVAARLPISFLAVDEAHCISQWGQDFRPSYLRILNFVEELPRRPVLGAFTATATAQVREDIERILQLRDPVRQLTGFDRPNLFFEVRRPEYKDRELLDIMESMRGKSGIVYCATRKKVETVCQLLQDHGFAAARYHAGLPEGERTASQEDFLYDRVTVMVATNAFGMGIDKSNVSFVIHYNMPKSIEAYYQEAGRAGRDGADAQCILLYSPGDVNIARFLIQNSSDNEELDPRQAERIRQQDLARLDAMTGYCKTDLCLRGYILEYFGQKHPEICGACGTCRGDFEVQDITEEAKTVLSCMQQVRDRLGYPLGVTTLARILQGSRERRLLELGLQSLPAYGSMKSVGITRIRAIMDRLEALEFAASDTEYATVDLTAAAEQVLDDKVRVTLLVRKQPESEKQTAAALSGSDGDLFEALKELRSRIARESAVPAYVIFSNATLLDMAKKKPRNTTEFRRISGVGELKCNWYGRRFLDGIRDYLDAHGN